jgi:hypothetical protein
VLGALLLVTGFAALMVTERHFPSSPPAKQWVLVLLATGLLLLLLHPPMPEAARRMWDEDHTPVTDEDDATIYGARPSVRTR